MKRQAIIGLLLGILAVASGFQIGWTARKRIVESREGTLDMLVLWLEHRGMSNMTVLMDCGSSSYAMELQRTNRLKLFEVEKRLFTNTVHKSNGSFL